jgi:hypothetical protein
VPFQGNIVMFSAPLMFRDKAQCATKTQRTRFSQSIRYAHGLGPARGAGSGFSIGNRCNAVAEHQGSALRVSLSAPMDCVVPFGKGITISCKARLAMNADKLTEYDNITVKGH